MPAALDVNKEEVRMLVLSVGVREAARQMGLNEDTVSTWSANGGWLAHTKPQAKPLLPLSLIPRSSITSKPADALQKALTERHEHTKLGLSLYAARASRQASRMPKHELLEAAPSVKAVADVMAKVWPEAQAGPATGQAMVVNISVLSASPDQSPVVHEMPEPDPLDDY